MQTSAQETRLPRALVRQKAALQDRYGQPEVKKAEPDPVVVGASAPPTDTPADPSATPPADPRENDLEYWKQRFTVLSGIQRKDRETYKVEKAALIQRVTELESELQAARAAAPATNEDLGEFFTPEQIEAMGEESAWATYRAVKKQVQTSIADAMKPFAARAQASEDDQRKAAEEAFLDRLTEIVPTWAEVDATDEWKAWLATETADGVERQVVLDKHVTARNADRVGKMFQDYLNATKRPTPPITPNGTGATPPGVPPKQDAALTKPTPGEITAFFKQAKLGKVNDKDRARFEERMKLL